MISDDLSTLFRPNSIGAALPAAYRQGVLLTFNTADGTNTVGVGTATLTNIPVLVTGAQVHLQAGDLVLLMVLGNTYLIAGKIAGVGSDTYAQGSTDLQQQTSQVSGFGVIGAPSLQNVVSASITVPSWAHFALLITNGAVAANNSTGVLSNLAGEVSMSRGGTGSVQQIATPAPYWTSLAFNWGYGGAVNPGEVLTSSILIQTNGGGAWAANGGNTASISFSALFQ